MTFLTNCSEDNHNFRIVKNGGMLDSIIEYEGGMQKGMIICYYPDGKTIKWSERTDGVMQVGVEIFYYPSGKISHYCSSENQFGVWYKKAFYENGRVKGLDFHDFMRGGVKFGNSYFYYSNGVMHYYNCLTFDGECMYVIVKDSLGNQIKEVGVTFDPSIHCNVKTDSVKLNKEINFDLIVARPPSKVSKLIVYDLNEKMKILSKQIIYPYTFLVRLNRTYKESGIKYISIVGELYNKNGELVLRDSAGKQLLVQN